MDPAESLDHATRATTAASIRLTVFGCDCELLPVTVLKEGQCHVNESCSVAWGEDLSLRSTEDNAVSGETDWISIPIHNTSAVLPCTRCTSNRRYDMI